MKPARNSRLAALLETIASEPGEKDKLVEKLHRANNEILHTDSLSQAKKVINENLFDIEQSLVEPKFESIMGSLRSWIIPRWNFISKNHPQYDETIKLFDSEDLKRFIQIQGEGSYIDIDAFLRKKNDISDELKAVLVSLKNLRLSHFG